jgi:hypothetical protein
LYRKAAWAPSNYVTGKLTDYRYSNYELMKYNYLV